jgi:hypothetical protein
MVEMYTGGGGGERAGGIIGMVRTSMAGGVDESRQWTTDSRQSRHETVDSRQQAAGSRPDKCGPELL